MINTCTVNQEERYFFSTNVVEAVREFFLICMLYVSMYMFTQNWTRRTSPLCGETLGESQ